MYFFAFTFGAMPIDIIFFNGGFIEQGDLEPFTSTNFDVETLYKLFESLLIA